MKKLSFSLIVYCCIGIGLTFTAQLTNAQKVPAKQPTESNKPQWQTLRQQLDQEYYGKKVKQGSELEKLIRDNQDFSMLRANEMNIRPELPPWLRVFWRKAHPEGEYSADDPTGGYPLVLKEILEWMMTHQDLKPGPGIEEREENEKKNTAAEVVGTNVRTSGLQAAARSESDIRVNYFDTTKILVASNNISSGGQQGVYYSTDGGANWSQTVLPLITGDFFHSDPTVDWTNDGRAWSSTLGINSSVTVLRLRNYFSTDNGATWTFEATPSGTQTFVDKQMVWVDKSPTSPFFGQMYAIWQGGPAFMNRRTAGAGGTWLTTPLTVSTGDGASGSRIGSDVKSNSVGDVFGFYPATTNRGLYVVKSTDGGNTFATAVRIGATFDSFDIGVPSFNNRRALIYISGGAYRTATKNLVYASWTDLSGDTGCTTQANEPAANVASTCKMRVWFSRSTDGGATWSAAVKINNQAGLNDQFNQWLVVDETTGKLGIIYYDTIADAGRKKTDVWYQSSFDDGVTWSTPEKVTTAMTDETVAGADSGNQYGDYNGLSGYADVFFPVWTDRRNNAREEIWTAKITTPVTAASASISGRVLNNQNRAVSRAIVLLQNTTNGEKRNVTTNSFGNFSFDGIPVGETYIISVYHKEFLYETRIFTLLEDMVNFDILPANPNVTTKRK